MRNKRNKRQVVVIIILLMGVVLTWFSSPSFSEIRNVDFIKIFTGGLLAGILISAFKELYMERKSDNSSNS